MGAQRLAGDAVLLQSVQQFPMRGAPLFFHLPIAPGLFVGGRNTVGTNPYHVQNHLLRVVTGGDLLFLFTLLLECGAMSPVEMLDMPTQFGSERLGLTGAGSRQERIAQFNQRHR